jgi:hypothetical protein
MKDSKRKELATRQALGPRFPRSPRADRVFAEPPAARFRRQRTGRNHPSKDAGE